MTQRKPPGSRRRPERTSPLVRAYAAARGPFTRHPDAVALITILAVALALRLAFTFRAPVFLVHDSVTYFEAGYNFARGAGFDLAFKRTPLYPLFIAAVVGLVGEDLQALGFVQHLLGALTAVLTYLLGRALFGRLAGLVAGLLVALSGPLIIYEHYVLAEALFIPLLVGVGLALVHGVQRARLHVECRRKADPGPWTARPYLWFALAGALLGLAALARPVGQAALLAVPPALLVAFGPWRRAALASLVVVVGYGASMGPWMGRNYVQNGSFESAGALGQTLIGRITRHDEGFTIPAPDSPSPYADPTRTEARALVLRQMAREARPSAINHRLRQTYAWTEAQANRAMLDACLEILWEQKERYVTGTLVKVRRLLWGQTEDFFGYHWGNRKSNELREDWVSNASIAHLLAPPTVLQEAEKRNAAAIVDIFSPHALGWPLLGLLVLGIVAGARSAERWAIILIVLLVLSLVLPAALLVGYVPRYRYPADPFLAVLIGGGLAWLLDLAAGFGRLARLRRAGSARAPLGQDPTRVAAEPAR